MRRLIYRWRIDCDLDHPPHFQGEVPLDVRKSPPTCTEIFGDIILVTVIVAVVIFAILKGVA